MRRYWILGAWLGFVSLALACGKPPLTPPGQGGNPWVQLVSKNFRVVSDLDEAEAADVAANLEETYNLLGAAIFHGGQVPSFLTDALIFRNRTDLRQFVGDDVGGQYMPWLPNDLEPSPTVLAWGSLSPFARLLFAHELTHRFNHVALGSTPLWLNEGIAEYYSTIRGQDGTPVTGEIDPRYQCVPDGLGDLQCYQYERITRKSLPKASEIIHFDRREFYDDAANQQGVLSWEQKRKRRGHYAMSLLLVHMLMHSDAEYAARFRSMLEQPPATDKGERLSDLVKGVLADRLDRDFDAYLGKRIPWRQHHSSRPTLPEDLGRRALLDSEVLVWWARLDAFRGPNQRRALRHLELATTNAPNDQGAPWFWRARHAALQRDADGAEKYYRRALEIEPGNAEYLYGLLDLYWGDRQGAAWEAAARSVRVGETVAQLARSARTATQLSAVAAYQLLTNDVPTALTTSAAACKADSACWPCFHNRAAALFASGDAEGAASAEAEAVSRLPESAPQAMADQLTQAVGFYRTAAGDADSVAGRPRPGVLAP